jgi:hypothetical protein
MVFLAGPDVEAGRFADTRARKRAWKEAAPGALGRALPKVLLLMTAPEQRVAGDVFPVEFLVLDLGNARLRVCP